MLHFGEIFSAEIYARNAIVVGDVKRVEGSRETMGFTRRFLWYFLFADEKKVRTFRVKGLSLRQKSSIFATSLVRGRRGTVCHRPCGRIISAPTIRPRVSSVSCVNPSAPSGHLPLHKGGFGAVGLQGVLTKIFQIFFLLLHICVQQKVFLSLLAERPIYSARRYTKNGTES